MKKKLLTLILASTMLVGATLTVNAEEIADSAAAAEGSEITGSSTVNLPTIKITVPTTADIIINPYQMTYEDEDAGITGNSQIISAEQEIESLSNVAVAVNVKDLTTTGVTDGINIETAALTNKVVTKSAFLYLEVVNAEENGSYAFADAYNKSSTSQIIIPNSEALDAKGKEIEAASKDAIVVLAASDETTPTTAAFKINGSVVANPVVVDEETDEKTAAPWTDADSIGISFKFTFSPQVVETTTN